MSGNVFLSGWAQTGISFLTTDFIYFLAGTAIAGVSPTAHVIACTLMFLVFTAGARLLLRTNISGYTPLKELMFLAIAGFPCMFSRSLLQSHSGGMIYVIGSILILISVEKTLRTETGTGSPNTEKGSGKTAKNTIICLLALFTVLLTLACIGDAIYFIAGVGAFVIYSLYRIWTDENTKKRLIYAAFIAASGIAVVLTSVFNKAYYAIGGAERNSYLADRLIFDTFKDVFDNLLLYLTVLFRMNDAGFVSQKIASVETVFLFVHAIIVLAGLYLVFIHLRNMAKKTEKDPVAAILSLGFAMVSSVLILTNVMIDAQYGRYISFAPVVFAILIIRQADSFLAENNEEKQIGQKEHDGQELQTELKKPENFNDIIRFAKENKYRLAIGILSVFLIAGAVMPFSFSLQPAETPQSRLAVFLEENNLENGYAYFWDASSVSVSSGNRVTVRAVLKIGDAYKKYNWFCKDEWYHEPANFVVTNCMPYNGFKENNIKKIFGEPYNLLRFEDYIIYVYDRDISKELQIDERFDYEPDNIDDKEKIEDETKK